MTFAARVLLVMLLLSWSLVAIFMGLQYYREKKFRIDLQVSEMQMLTARAADAMERGRDIDSVAAAPMLARYRVTLIAPDGSVAFDDNDAQAIPVDNHNDRPEVIEARTSGTGHITERRSHTDKSKYFYAARLLPDGSVFRIAAPYNHSLTAFLAADQTTLWTMLGLTLLMSLVGFFASNKISKSITRLNRFAEAAESGEMPEFDETFPHDELGSIASHIVHLYTNLDGEHREALRQEQEKIRIKKQLTNNINHELKTPVASILVASELLRDHPELPADKKAEFEERIYANALRLKSLLNDVAYITRMDEGAHLIEMEPVDVAAVVQEVVADERLRAPHITFNCRVAPLTINGNRALLESIFRNLLDNAVAYSGADRVEVIGTEQGEFVVADNGTGVPEEHLAHIFERFYRIDKGRSRAMGGTGLGLSIVKNAVTIHGGVIKVENCSGLRFSFNVTSRQ